MAAQPHHHVLMIATDDMRPELEPYGHSYMATPHLKDLADDGFLMRRAYVNFALCAPSRTALLNSRRPDASRVWAIGPYFRETTGRNFTTLPQAFREQGYRSIGHGKIFHEGNASGWPLDQDQMFGSWSVPYYHPPFDGYDGYRNCSADPRPDCKGKPHSYLEVDEPWETFNDGMSALRAVEWIKNASAYDEPFFLAVGFHRPHIPYIYPKQFAFVGDVAFPPSNHKIPSDIPPCAMHDWTGEGLEYGDLFALTPNISQGHSTAAAFQTNVSQLCEAAPFSVQRSMKRAYFSCLQYVDHLVGVLISALREASLYEKTTVIFWGDHGYKLGEHCDWFKHDNFEDSARIPVILKPAIASLPEGTVRGREVTQLVEEVDIYPTLLELAGLSAVGLGLQGESWVPLLGASGEAEQEGWGGDARRGGAAARDPPPWKDAVFWQYPRYDAAKRTPSMGYTIRTAAPDAWRYTVWLPFACDVDDPMNKCADDAAVAPRWGEQLAVELYDHRDDASDEFERFENANLAHLPEYQKQVAALHAKIVQRWAPPSERSAASIAAPHGRE